MKALTAIVFLAAAALVSAQQPNPVLVNPSTNVLTKPTAAQFRTANDLLAASTAATSYQPLDSDLTSWAGITRASGFDTFVATPSGANFASLLTTALPASKGGTGLTSLAANVVTLLGAADYAAMRTQLSLVPGTDVQAYDADLASIAGNTTGGFLTRTAANTYTPRTITGTAGEIDVANGDGVSGAPVISLPSTITQATTFGGSTSPLTVEFLSGGTGITSRITSVGGTPEALRLQSTSNQAQDRGISQTFYIPTATNSTRLGAQIVVANTAAPGLGSYFSFQTENASGTVAEKVRIAATGDTSFASATPSTSTTTGSATFGGGIGVAGAGYFGGSVNATNTLRAVSADGTDAVLDLTQTARRQWRWRIPAGSSTLNLRDVDGGFDALTVTHGSGRFSLTPANHSTPSWATTGALASFGGATVTNSSTAASGTVASAVFHSFAVPTLAATNASVTTTDAATLYIAGAPIAGTNQTVTRAWGFWNAGASRFDDTLSIFSGKSLRLYKPDNAEFASLNMSAASRVSLNYPLDLTNNTTSTSTTTGALTVTGGIGVQGATWGSTFNSAANAPFNSTTNAVAALQMKSASSTIAFGVNASDVFGFGFGGVFPAEYQLYTSGSVGLRVIGSIGGVSSTYTTDATTGGAGALTTAGGIYAAKKIITPSTVQATGGYVGTATNDSADAGEVGEYITANNSIFLTNGVMANVTSISLTAGDWDVTGMMSFGYDAATVTDVLAGTSSTSAFLITANSAGGLRQFTTVTGSDAFALPTVRFSLSTTTTIYLPAYASFSAGSVTATGVIRARRIR